MKETLETAAAIIFLILLGTVLFMELTVRCGSAMDSVRQQIKEEGMIF